MVPAMTALQEQLAELDACDDSREWVGRRTLSQAWAECERGDWMLWLAARAGVDRRLVVRAACACARTALAYVPVGEERPLKAIETAEAWTRGEATIEEVRRADADAYDAYAAAAADADAADSAASLRESACIIRSIISLETVEAALFEAPR